MYFHQNINKMHFLKCCGVAFVRNWTKWLFQCERFQTSIDSDGGKYLLHLSECCTFCSFKGIKSFARCCYQPQSGCAANTPLSYQCPACTEPSWTAARPLFPGKKANVNDSDTVWPLLTRRNNCSLSCLCRWRCWGTADKLFQWMWTQEWFFLTRGSAHSAQKGSHMPEVSSIYSAEMWR